MDRPTGPTETPSSAPTEICARDLNVLTALSVLRINITRRRHGQQSIPATIRPSLLDTTTVHAYLPSVSSAPTYTWTTRRHIVNTASKIHCNHLLRNKVLSAERPNLKAPAHPGDGDGRRGAPAAVSQLRHHDAAAIPAQRRSTRVTLRYTHIRVGVQSQPPPPAGEHEPRLDDGEEHHPLGDLQQLLRNLLLPFIHRRTGKGRHRHRHRRKGR